MKKGMQSNKIYHFLRYILLRLWDDLVMIDAYPADDNILSLAHS
jgi:hypothetical protein